MRTQKYTTSRFTRYMLLALLSPALLEPPTAQAQGADVEEITVTARKREEGLQEVPMAITAIDGLEIAKLNIQNVEELYGRVPGLFFTSAGGAGPNSDFIYLQIRGVGFNGGLEPAVGVFVDGMYMPQVGFDLDFLDVERIEVLRGPQGTLFGRNTQAGALNIVTKQPSDEFGGRFEAEVADFGTIRARGAISGALSDSLFAGINLQYAETDGFIDGVTTGQKFGSSEQFTGRVNLRYEPNDDLKITFIGDASSRDFLDPGTVVLLDGDGRGHWESFADQDTDDTKDTVGAQLTIDWSIANSVTLTSLTGFRSVESDNTYDPDFNVSDQTPATFGPVTESTSTPTIPIVVAPDPITFAGVTHDTGLQQDFFSQELRLAGSTDRLDWLAGVYYFDQAIEQSRAFDIGPGIPFVPLYIRELFTEDRDGYAGFGQVGFRPNDAWELTFGARYSSEDTIKGGQRVLNISDSVIFAFPTDGTADDNNTSLLASASYRFNDDALGYLTYAEGWKAGGINRFPSRGNAILPYDSEESTNIELGLKATWMDGRLTTNVAAYTIDIKGQQVLTVVPDPGGATPVTIIDNAANSTSSGFELELTAALTETLTFDLAYANMNTEFDEYFLNDGAGIPTVDKSGDEFQFVPDQTASATLSFVVPLQWNSSELEMAFNYRYVGSYLVPNGNFNAALGDQLIVPSHNRLDFRASLGWDDWQATVFVNNISNSFDYTNIGMDPFLPVESAPLYVTALSPRQVGLIVSKSF